MVSTNAATGNPNVKALVYVAAFIPDINESAAELASKFPGGAPQNAILPRPFPGGLDLYISPDQFHSIFAADLPATRTSVMASAERPIALAAFTEPSRPPAWKTIPSWTLVATDDHAIGTANAEFMAQRATRNVAEIDASHAVLISHPDAVEALIQTADLATR
jgi:pimeloyl-ACP methyl ester carboxylesterase